MSFLSNFQVKLGSLDKELFNTAFKVVKPFYDEKKGLLFNLPKDKLYIYIGLLLNCKQDFDYSNLTDKGVFIFKKNYLNNELVSISSDVFSFGEKADISAYNSLLSDFGFNPSNKTYVIDYSRANFLTGGSNLFNSDFFYCGLGADFVVTLDKEKEFLLANNDLLGVFMDITYLNGFVSMAPIISLNSFRGLLKGDNINSNSEIYFTDLFLKFKNESEEFSENLDCIGKKLSFSFGEFLINYNPTGRLSNGSRDYVNINYFDGNPRSKFLRVTVDYLRKFQFAGESYLKLGYIGIHSASIGLGSLYRSFYINLKTSDDYINKENLIVGFNYYNDYLRIVRLYLYDFYFSRDDFNQSRFFFIDTMYKEREQFFGHYETLLEMRFENGLKNIIKDDFILDTSTFKPFEVFEQEHNEQVTQWKETYRGIRVE